MKIRLLTLALCLAPMAARAGDGAAVAFPLLSDREAWSHLPKAERGQDQPLPGWARALARGLPRTTAAMLELDWLHRARNPIGPVLRGEMRWVAADANRCAYSKAAAEADLRHAGVDVRGIAALRAGPERWPAEDRAALIFARQMTVNAAAVTDAQVASLRESYGEEKLVAMVLLLAYSNFQDRLLLSLGLPPEEGGPKPPLDCRFPREKVAPEVPARARPEERHGPEAPTTVDDPEWAGVGFETLQANLDTQRGNGGRIRVPTFEEYMKKLPADAPRPKAPVKIKWSLVCMVYQPALAAGWSACTTAFREEAKQDRVFEESLFWIVTRTIDCFY
ncbi:MAG: hypothetical protein U0790_17330 [Isosphaeraceae bacterium]